MSSLPITDKRLQSIKNETDKDESLQIVKQNIQEGWPLSQNELIKNVKLLFNIWDKLNTAKGLVLKF